MGVVAYDEHGVTATGTINSQTGEIDEIEAPADHTRRTKYTGRQILKMLQEREEHGYYSAPTGRDKEFLVGEDGELIESDSAVRLAHRVMRGLLRQLRGL